MIKVSIIVRTKNEEKWIRPCLDMIYKQEMKDFEVILVDDHSTDRTLEIASAYPVRLVHYTQAYKPGKALNAGIREAKGEFIVCISGHCIPCTPHWLSRLLRNFDDDKVAGVYGRQEPLPYSSPKDKRDLWTIFGLDRKVQVKDPFFHNANSMLRKSLWDQIPFDEEATNIEDRIWAKQIISQGYHLIYEPEASVYHWHGVHQNDNEERCKGVVRILESIHGGDFKTWEPSARNPLKTVAIIPVRGEPLSVNGKTLLHYTIERARESKYISQVVVSTDNEKTAQLAKSLGALVPFIRPPELSLGFVGLGPVISFTVEQLERNGISMDHILVLQPNNPFRPKGFIDDLIKEMLYTNVDTLIPVKKDLSLLFKKGEDGQVVQLEEDFTPNEMKELKYSAMPGLGVLMKSNVTRDSSLISGNVGIYPIVTQLSHLEINNASDAEQLAPVLSLFWEEGKIETDLSFYHEHKLPQSDLNPRA